MMEFLRRILKNQGGQALPMTLILLVLGGLLIVPMLSFMTTNLNANRVIETKTEGIYAADAGIQDALWKLANGVDPFPGGAMSYELTEGGNPVLINGMSVTIERVAIDENLYTLRSTSRLDGDIKAVITAQAVAGSTDYSWLFEQAITSGGDIDTSPHDIIYGGVLCGGEFNGDEDQVRTGEITDNADINFPPPEELMEFYLATFDPEVDTYYPPDHSYPSGTYTIQSGTTKDDPHMIPAIYRIGDLTINGNGYGKLSGTIYLTGKLWVAPGTTIDLNGHTIFSEWNSSCDPVTGECDDTNAINFQPNCSIYGPGCIIAVGNINYQPNLGVGDQLLGTTDLDTEDDTCFGNSFVLSKFRASTSGIMSSFQVKCYIADPEAPPAHVKVGIYADNAGVPGALLNKIDDSDNVTVLSGWNPVNFDATSIVSRTYYWLAGIADADVISVKSPNEPSLNKSAAFTGFLFPNPAGTGLTTPTPANTYMFRGFSNSQAFIFLMSVCCKVNLQPNASFYGSIAGETNVELSPHCTINLVDYDENELEFPGVGGSATGPSTGGNSPPILTYNIE